MILKGANPSGHEMSHFCENSSIALLLLKLLKFGYLSLLED